jgi:predicted nucleic acid-binding protein
MMIYSLDNNIISFYLNDKHDMRRIIDNAIPADRKFIVPPISLYETRRGLLYNNAGRKMHEFNEKFIPLADDVMQKQDWELAAMIYVYLVHKGFNPEDDDIFQAAYCINRGYTLVTDNTSHFENIPGLLYEDWVNR